MRCPSITAASGAASCCGSSCCCANCLPAALLAIAILFLAHPVTFTPPEVERKLNNVQFVLDTSGSMAEDHGSQAEGRHRRFDSAMEAIEQFINYRKGDAFGLTIFSRDFIHWLPLTLDTQSIALSKRFIEPNNPKLDPPGMGRHGLPDELWGNTFIGKALLGAADLLAAAPHRRPHDHPHDRWRKQRHQAAARCRRSSPALRAENITVFSILLTDDPIEPAAHRHHPRHRRRSLQRRHPRSPRRPSSSASTR